MERMTDIISTFEPYKIQNDWIKTMRYYFDTVWLTYSIAGMVPLLAVTLYRYLYPIEKPEQYLNTKNFKKTKGYFLVKSLTFLAFYYYIIDVILTAFDGSYTNVCRFAFLTHHVPSIPLLYFVNKLNYVPWWTLVIASWHALLLTFPDAQILNYPYLAFIAYFHYMIYYKSPYNTMEVFPFMYVALVTIWFYDCKNYLPFL